MAKLTMANRRQLAKTKAMRDKNFGVPSKAPKSGSYPIHDVSHARSALSYGSRNLNAKDYQSLKMKVKRKYPSMKIKGIP